MPTHALTIPLHQAHQPLMQYVHAASVKMILGAVIPTLVGKNGDRLTGWIKEEVLGAVFKLSNSNNWGLISDMGVPKVVSAFRIIN